MHQIKCFKIREHHLVSAVLGVGVDGVEVARKWVGTVEAVVFRKVVAVSLSILTAMLHGGELESAGKMCNDLEPFQKGKNRVQAYLNWVNSTRRRRGCRARDSFDSC